MRIIQLSLITTGKSEGRKTQKSPSILHLPRSPFAAKPPFTFPCSASPSLNPPFQVPTRVYWPGLSLQIVPQASRGDGVAAGLCGGGRNGGRAAMRLGCRQPRRRASHGGPERAVASADDEACRVPPHRRGWMLLLVCFCSRPLLAFFASGAA